MTHSGRHNKCPTCGNRLSIGAQKTDTETITIKACSRCGWSNKPKTQEELQRIKIAEDFKKRAMADKTPETPHGAKGTPEWKKKKLEKARKKKAIQDILNRTIIPPMVTK